MDSTVDAVRGYYDENAQLEWDRLEKHPFEFIFTTGMMERYIRPGTAYWTSAAARGATASTMPKWAAGWCWRSLPAAMWPWPREKAAEAGVAIETHVCDCLELERLDLGQFDHVFLMGPLYHLQREEDRVRAVEIALAHLKPGGMLYVSFILTFAGIIYDLQNEGYVVEDLKNPLAMELVEAVDRGEDYCGPGFTEVYFYHQRNILPLYGALPPGEAAPLWPRGHPGPQLPGDPVPEPGGVSGLAHGGPAVSGGAGAAVLF